MQIWKTFKLIKAFILQQRNVTSFQPLVVRIQAVRYSRCEIKYDSRQYPILCVKKSTTSLASRASYLSN
ncbi:hypothetical protein EFM55_14805 [Lactiplantibacillus pentosus]|nr:hypothetical protein [Lactiplantibacillus pentosus]